MTVRVLGRGIDEVAAVLGPPSRIRDRWIDYDTFGAVLIIDTKTNIVETIIYRFDRNRAVANVLVSATGITAEIGAADLASLLPDPVTETIPFPQPNGRWVEQTQVNSGCMRNFGTFDAAGRLVDFRVTRFTPTPGP